MNFKKYLALGTALTLTLLAGCGSSGSGSGSGPAQAVISEAQISQFMLTAPA